MMEIVLQRHVHTNHTRQHLRKYAVQVNLSEYINIKILPFRREEAVHTSAKANHQALDVLVTVCVLVEFVFKRHAEMAFKELMKHVTRTMTVQVVYVLTRFVRQDCSEFPHLVMITMIANQYPVHLNHTRQHLGKYAAQVNLSEYISI